MNRFLSIATDDGRPYRLVSVAALAASIFGIAWLGIVLLFPPPDMARARQQASDLQALIRRVSQFAEVRVEPFTNGKLVVFAPDELPAAAKAELERIVAQNAPNGTAPVSYMRLIDPAELNPK